MSGSNKPETRAERLTIVHEGEEEREGRGIISSIFSHPIHPARIPLISVVYSNTTINCCAQPGGLSGGEAVVS